MGKLEKGEGIGGVVEHENGGGKVAWCCCLSVTVACCFWGKGDAAIAAAMREELGRRCLWLSWGRENAAGCCVP